MVDVEAASVGADLRDEYHQRPVVHPEDAVESSEADFHLLPYCRQSGVALCRQEKTTPAEGLFEQPATVGEILKTLAYRSTGESGFGQELLWQGHVRHLSYGQLIGDGHPVSRAKQMRLNHIDAEGVLPYPRRSKKLGDCLTWRGRKIASRAS